MHLNDFMKESRYILEDFERVWRYMNSLQPDVYPMELPPGDFWEQCTIHEPTGDTNHVCGSTGYIHFTSMNKRQCNICDKVIPWPLKKGKAPLLGNNRQTGDTKVEED